MPPQADRKTFQSSKEYVEEFKETEIKPLTVEGPKIQLIWINVIGCVFMHLGAVYGLYLFMFKVMWMTFFYTLFLDTFCSLSITAGSHRLWSHRTYKARLPLQIFLVFFNTVAFQFSAWRWAREHRLHHKYTDTDADPHNSKRGFFFSHLGWTLIKRHPEVKANMNNIDMSDIDSDPVVNFQKRYYTKLSPLACYVLAPYLASLWGESLWNAFFVCGVLRQIVVLHRACSVNSVTHMWGMKPYDKHIYPVDNKIVSWITGGEGFHNYHHTFPWDYKTAELSGYGFNITKLFIDVMAAIGWAYDLKTVSADVVRKRMERTGDGSY